MSENVPVRPPEPKPRVLLVHQDPAFREALVRQLAMRGYQVVGVDTSQAALERARSDPPEVVILDQDAFEANGSNTLREIKQLGSLTPVILLLRNGSRLSEHLRRQPQIVDYCYKPCGLDELIAKLEAARNARSRPKPKGVARWLAQVWSGLTRSVGLAASSAERKGVP
ncbi:MAG: hypothetical protein A2V67_02630 [Deltaproteobacteria bacterium RBG_13_61_14]|nr:MAG: hypothetical protein A2V67_02630 [Deltaproteobacteria bacterium RBG_13_61_14]